MGKASPCTGVILQGDEPGSQPKVCFQGHSQFGAGRAGRHEIANASDSSSSHPKN